MTKSNKFVYILLLLTDAFFPSECFTSQTTSRSAVGGSAKELYGQRQQQHEKDGMNVHVYENAFSPMACELLHELAVSHNERTNDGSSIFTRPPFHTRPLTPIEHAIDSALIGMNDTSRTVEYWSREEYMNIDLHADIDETMLENGGPVRCPQMGHVLYLQVKEGIKGPTCVFPGEQVGWGLNDNDDAGADAHVHDEKELYIVPCVQGRILRFPGNAMHSVPSPPHRWLLSRKEERLLREKEEGSCGEEFDIDDDYDDDWVDGEDIDWDDDEDEVERSVLLFNTWPDDETPPIGVNGDYATGALPDGIELSEEDAESYLKSEEARILLEWEEDYGKNGEALRCNPISQWNKLDIENIGGDREARKAEVNVSLMGNQNRRLYPDKYVQLWGTEGVIKDALEETSRASLIHLVRKNK